MTQNALQGAGGEDGREASHFGSCQNMRSEAEVAMGSARTHNYAGRVFAGPVLPRHQVMDHPTPTPHVPAGWEPTLLPPASQRHVRAVGAGPGRRAVLRQL